MDGTSADENDFKICEPEKSLMNTEWNENFSGIVAAREKWRNIPATVVGTAVHRLMQALVDRRAERLSPEERTCVVKAIISEECIATGDSMSVFNALKQVADVVCDGGYPQSVTERDRETYPWIPEIVADDLLSHLRDAEEVYTEMPFAVCLAGESTELQYLAKSLEISTERDGFINGIMDLLYKKDGKWYICDYKTNYSKERLYENYRGQLLLYREIARSILQLPEAPQAYLYHIPCKTDVIVNDRW